MYGEAINILTSRGNARKTVFLTVSGTVETVILTVRTVMFYGELRRGRGSAKFAYLRGFL
jgi:hypothetical protein